MKQFIPKNAIICIDFVTGTDVATKQRELAPNNIH